MIIRLTKENREEVAVNMDRVVSYVRRDLYTWIKFEKGPELKVEETFDDIEKKIQEQYQAMAKSFRIGVLS